MISYLSPKQLIELGYKIKYSESLKVLIDSKGLSIAIRVFRYIILIKAGAISGIDFNTERNPYLVSSLEALSKPSSSANGP